MNRALIFLFFLTVYACLYQDNNSNNERKNKFVIMNNQDSLKFENIINHALYDIEVIIESMLKNDNIELEEQYRMEKIKRLVNTYYEKNVDSLLITYEFYLKEKTLSNIKLNLRKGEIIPNRYVGSASSDFVRMLPRQKKPILLLPRNINIKNNSKDSMNTTIHVLCEEIEPYHRNNITYKYDIKIFMPPLGLKPYPFKFEVRLLIPLDLNQYIEMLEKNDTLYTPKPAKS